jgi:hypothetical protein
VFSPPPYSVFLRSAVVTMLATRQVLGNVARSRVMANLGLRRTMATVTDSPLDKKVGRLLCPSDMVLVLSRAKFLAI